jgi:hypothetical protein
MMKPFLAGTLAASFLASCGGGGGTSGVYECSVTCTVQGGGTTTSAPFMETKASQMDAVDACQSNAEAQVMTICGSASATVSCVCDPTM